MTEVTTTTEADGSGDISPDFHPNETVLLVFSDLARLYGCGVSGPGQRTPKSGDVATSRKLGFYAARVVCTRAATLRVLADEVLARSKLIVLESGGEEEWTEGLISASGCAAPVRSRLIIEEL